MKAEVISLVQYRLTQAKDTLAAARELMKGGHHRDAVNRAYYAMFYATLGLLARKLLGSSKHSGVMSLFSQNFIKTGKFSVDVGKNLQRSFELRQKCDYQEFV